MIQGCMSKGGIPVQPYFVLGGFPEKEYHGNILIFKFQFKITSRFILEATAATITFLLDNYDGQSTDEETVKNLERAKKWEKTYVDFLQVIKVFKSQ